MNIKVKEFVLKLLFCNGYDFMWDVFKQDKKSYTNTIRTEYDKQNEIVRSKTYHILKTFLEVDKTNNFYKDAEIYLLSLMDGGFDRGGTNVFVVNDNNNIFVVSKTDEIDVDDYFYYEDERGVFTPLLCYSKDKGLLNNDFVNIRKTDVVYGAYKIIFSTIKLSNVYSLYL